MKTFAPLISLCTVVALFSCKGNSTTGITADYRVSPAALSFSACPNKTEDGQTVPDVFPDTQKLMISNASRAPAGLKMSISGPDAAAFSIVSPAPTGVPANGEATVSIAFAPSKKGDVTAVLAIDDQVEGTDDLKVTLSGAGKTLPVQATVQAATQSQDGTKATTCRQFEYCESQFPDTLFDKTVTRQIKLRNVGCPALKITGLAISSSRGGTQGFSIVEPVQQPSSTSPLLLSTADATDEITITVAFTPTDDGSLDAQRDAVLTVTSSDPVNPSLLIALSANGVKPAAYATPNACDFSNASDKCGNASKVPGSATFRITNDGSTSIKILSTTFKSTSSQTAGVNGRFQITGAIAGSVIAMGQSANLVVGHTEAPLYVTEQIEVKAVAASDETTEVGSITLALFGGSKPCLTTDPADSLNFMNAATAETTQTVTIKNGTGCGALTLSSVSIDQSNFFKLSAPVLPANTDVAPGASVTANVTYTRPPSGGMQIGTLRIVSNDSDYGQAKLVQLLSASPLDELPVAELRACVPAELTSDPTCAMGARVSLSASLTNLGSNRTITLSGITSTDGVNGMPGSTRPVAKYKFTLLAPYPQNVTTMNLANHDTEQTSATTTLTITSAVALYRIGLIVYDDRAQQSTASNLNVNITQ